MLPIFMGALRMDLFLTTSQQASTRPASILWQDPVPPALERVEERKRPTRMEWRAFGGKRETRQAYDRSAPRQATFEGLKNRFKQKSENESRGFQAQAEKYSVQQEAYRSALDYDKARSRQKKAMSILRMLALIVLVPVLLVALFVASYALTCILNGATPAEVMELLGLLVERVRGFIFQALA